MLSTPSASLGAGLGKGISGSELDKKIKGKEASANGEGESAPEENNPGDILADLAEFRARLAQAGAIVREDKPIAGYHRCFTEDPFGNRIELMQKL